ncbi:MAG: SpoIIE family protein phosphatase, partial [Proteobacteria bacterium]|nr:SpoIIE family protein phosphatase [Pseudomonadota bacterium]
MEKFNAEEYISGVSFTFDTLVGPWKDHPLTTMKNLMHAYQKGIEAGQLEYACMSLYRYDTVAVRIDKGLVEIEQDMKKHNRILKKHRQVPPILLHNIYWQMTLNLIGKSDDPVVFKGDAFNEFYEEKTFKESRNFTAMAILYVAKFDLLYMFHRYEEAFLLHEKTWEYINNVKGTSQMRWMNDIGSLIMLSLCDTASPEKKKVFLEKVSENQKIFKTWSDASPDNFLQDYLLVEAEQARVSGKYIEAEDFYDQAIRHSQKQGYLKLEALANERAFLFYLARGRTKIAAVYLTEALQCYNRWNAYAKVRHIKENYGYLLTAESPKTRFVSSDRDSQKIKASTLDLSTVLKASRAISGEIVLSRLLVTLMKIVMENAGAEKGFMLLQEKDHLFIEAEMAVGKDEIPVLQSIPLDSHDGLAKTIVHYVARTHESQVLGNASAEGVFKADDYIRKNQPKSILCTPILNQGRLSAVVYLENNLTADAFTPERIEVLNLLSSQAAVSIDNARLYESLEDKVEQRTLELSEARDALWGEMELAKRIQTTLLPEHPAIEGFEIAAYMKPDDEVGGDYYDVIHVAGKDWIVIGDVSGHGVPAGLIMMMVQTSIHTALEKYPDMSPVELLTIVNAVISRNIKKLKEDKYMTITVLAYAVNGQFDFAGAHQDILIYRSSSGGVESIETHGVWIGMTDDIKNMLQVDQVKLNKRDVMLLYTDGIPEARDSSGNMFSEEKLADLFQKLG